MQDADAASTPFGIRSIEFDADKGFLLNGERVKLNGVCLHDDGGAVGTAVPQRIWERRFALLKEMGCNAIRASHNPHTPEFFDLCDRMGFLVMAEAFDEWREPKSQTPEYRLPPLLRRVGCARPGRHDRARSQSSLHRHLECGQRGSRPGCAPRRGDAARLE